MEPINHQDLQKAIEVLQNQGKIDLLGADLTASKLASDILSSCQGSGHSSVDVQVSAETFIENPKLYPFYALYERATQAENPLVPVVFTSAQEDQTCFTFTHYVRLKELQNIPSIAHFNDLEPQPLVLVDGLSQDEVEALFHLLFDETLPTTSAHQIPPQAALNFLHRYNYFYSFFKKALRNPDRLPRDIWQSLYDYFNHADSQLDDKDRRWKLLAQLHTCQFSEDFVPPEKHEQILGELKRLFGSLHQDTLDLLEINRHSSNIPVSYTRILELEARYGFQLSDERLYRALRRYAWFHKQLIHKKVITTSPFSEENFRSRLEDFLANPPAPIQSLYLYELPKDNLLLNEASAEVVGAVRVRVLKLSNSNLGDALRVLPLTSDEIDLTSNQLSELPACLVKSFSPTLKILKLRGNPLSSFPDLSQTLIEYLDVSYCGLTSIPPHFLPKTLKVLHASHNPLTSAPDLSETGIESLDFVKNPMQNFPQKLPPNLKILDLSFNEDLSYPDSWDFLPDSLEELHLCLNNPPLSVFDSGVPLIKIYYQEANLEGDGRFSKIKDEGLLVTYKYPSPKDPSKECFVHEAMC